jgi:hypothetical protein
MRIFAVSVAACLLATYGCAASEDSEPPSGGNNNTGGSLAIAGTTSSAGGSTSTAGGSTPTGTAGTTVVPQGGSTSTAGTGPTGTAGTTPVGTAGTTSTGGTGSAAGTCMTTAVSAGMPLLIDNMDDNNGNIDAVDGRMGGWFLATDKTGTIKPTDGVPVPEAGGMTGSGIHITGTGLTGWGASLSAALVPAMGCYNASKFKGISVALKGTGNVLVSVLTAAVRDAPEGMRNHYKKQVALTADWTTVPIAWTDLMQLGGWGVMVPFDATKIYGIDIGPLPATAPAKTDYDIWVDNLSFQ